MEQPLALQHITVQKFLQLQYLGGIRLVSSSSSFPIDPIFLTFCDLKDDNLVTQLKVPNDAQAQLKLVTHFFPFYFWAFIVAIIATVVYVCSLIWKSVRLSRIASLLTVAAAAFTLIPVVVDLHFIVKTLKGSVQIGAAVILALVATSLLLSSAILHILGTGSGISEIQSPDVQKAKEERRLCRLSRWLWRMWLQIHFIVTHICSCKP